MDSLKPKIAMYVQRPFGDKLTAAFHFFSENWKVLLKYFAYFILPVCILQALSMNTFLGSYMEMMTAGVAGAGLDNPLAYFTGSFWLSYGLMILLSAFGGLLIYSLVFALVKLYNDREERLVGLTYAELKPVFFGHVKRLFVMGLFLAAVLFAALLVLGLSAAFSPFTLLLTIPAFIACIVPLTLLAPIYLFEEIGLWAAFVKSLRLGFATWGGIFGVSVVMGFIANVLYGVASIPWYVLYFIGLAFSMSDVQSAVTSSVGYSFATYLFGVIMLFAIYVSMTFPILGLIYQYGHSCDKIENVSIVDDIDKFELL